MKTWRRIERWSDSREQLLTPSSPLQDDGGRSATAAILRPMQSTDSSREDQSAPARGVDEICDAEGTYTNPSGRQAFGESWPEFDEALRLDSVSWEQVVSAFFWADLNSKPEPTAEMFGEYHKRLSQSFFKNHGGPKESYISWDPIAYVVVTSQGELHSTVNTALTQVTQEVEPAYRRTIDLIQSVQRLHHRSYLLLGRADHGLLMRRLRSAMQIPERSVQATIVEDLYQIMAYSVQILEGIERQEDLPYEELIEIQEKAFQATKSRFHLAVRRRAALFYLMGMLIGLLVVPLLVLNLPGLFIQDESTVQLMKVTIVMGTVGAFVSVMLRLSRSKLHFRDDAVRWEIVLLGSLRVLLGLVFGLVMYVLVFSRLLPLEIPTNSEDRLWLFSALGFIAGFSETLVPDQLLPKTSLGETHEEGPGNSSTSR